MRHVFLKSVFVAAVALSAAPAQVSEWVQLVNRGDTLERNGSYQEAAVTYEAALRTAGAFGPADRRVPLTMNKLAMIYAELGRFSDAAHLYDRALKMVERSYGKNTQEYSSLLNNLAAVHLESGQFAKAETLIRETLAINQSMAEPDLQQLAKGRSILADVLIKRAKYAEADRLLAQAIQFFEGEPTGQRDLGIAKNNLAVVRGFQKRNDESRRLSEEAAAVIESDAGSNHPILARILNNLAHTYAAIGLREEADAAYRRSIQIAEARLGPEHPQYGAMLYNYAEFLRKTGHKPEAKVLEARAREVIEQSVRQNGTGMTVDVSAFRGK